MRRESTFQQLMEKELGLGPGLLSTLPDLMSNILREREESNETEIAKTLEHSFLTKVVVGGGPFGCKSSGNFNQK